jgi:hypothetical protein
LPSVNGRHSSKYTVSSAKRCALGIEATFAECQHLAVGKVNGRQLYTAADGPLPRVAFRRVLVFAETTVLPSAALGRGGFAEC